MKVKIAKNTILGLCMLGTISALAGNPDRAGQAGATQLLINPWARSTGWNGLNSASVQGLEAERINVAGLAFTKRTDIHFSRTNFLSGSDIFYNAFGIAQRVSETGVLGISVMSIDYGSIEITTDANPDGGLGTYKPSYVNIGISYAKEFSKRIYGGFTTRLITESISDLNAQGFALDAGIQYVTGKDDRIKFGIALRNVGTPMRFGGDGLTYRGNVVGSTNTISLAQRTQGFEMPSLMNIGASYDFFLGTNNKLTVVGNFTSNSFTRDQFGAGAELNLKKVVMIRAGYNYEKDLTNTEKRATVYTGFAAGLTVDVPFSKDKEKTSGFALDYSYRPTAVFNGTHTFGAKLSF